MTLYFRHVVPVIVIVLFGYMSKLRSPCNGESAHDISDVLKHFRLEVAFRLERRVGVKVGQSLAVAVMARQQ